MGLGHRVRDLRHAFSFQLLAGTLAVSLPLLLGLSIGLTYLSAQQITLAASDHAGANASSAAIAVSDWVAERQRELSQVARGEQDQVDSPGIASTIRGLGAVYPNFKLVEIVDRTGRNVATTSSGGALDAASASWFADSLLKPTTQSIHQVPGGLEWLMTSPIVGSDNVPQGVAIGNLQIANLGSQLREFDPGNVDQTQVYLVDAQGMLLYSSDWVGLPDAAAMQAKGTLRLKASGPAVSAALGGASGSLRTLDYNGVDVVAGYAPVPALGWAVISATSVGAALATIGDQVRLAALLVVFSALPLPAFAYVSARIPTRPFRELRRPSPPGPARHPS